MLADAKGLVAVISPHLDDAVFSCGDLLAHTANATVVTVCTGLPDDPMRLTDWDRNCGFASASEAMAERLQENRRALAILGCDGQELGLRDSQYVSDWQPHMEPLRQTLIDVLQALQPQRVVMPLGLFHDDHVRVSNTLLSLIEAFPAREWLAYEDIPYRARARLVEERLFEIRARGVYVHRGPAPARSQQKVEAVLAYRSQLAGFGRRPDDLARPEGYWALALNEEAK
ncbi:PIG-L family deacetylase [Bordetella sp. 02P26C-1]|uniref:PIG-L family deacetylase n=1 Tax=Bordetella sp. 02P26C-1 TaxID=2683195 RepID=UPI0013523C10|nr:PIG-L family deacetylase [Bordetella sp. 02P26C-1]